VLSKARSLIQFIAGCVGIGNGASAPGDRFAAPVPLTAKATTAISVTAAARHGHTEDFMADP
jgi:hypothetical protein